MGIVLQLFANLTYFAQITVSLGGIALALIAIIQLWKMVAPDYAKKIEEMETYFAEEFETLEKRITQNEKNISLVDVPFIHKRFDKMEKKIDDLMTLLITHFK